MALPNENNSWVFKSNELHSDNNAHADFSQITSEEDQNNNPSLNQHNKSDILSDPILDYINRYLLEEDIDDKISSYQEAALWDMEKPFYDILEESQPSKDNQSLSTISEHNPNFTICISKQNVGSSLSESPKQHSSVENLLASEFQRGVEEGMKFLPNLSNMSINLQESKLSMDPTKKLDSNSLELRLGKENESGLLDKSKGKKNINDKDLDLLEGRNHKIPMLSIEETIRDEMFDKALLYHGENYAREEISSLRETTKHKANSYSKNLNQDENINIKALLIACAEAISMNENKVASELIRRIRKHASPIGDGSERLACVLADGLEARLAGTGSATYRLAATTRVSTNDYLKSYHMCIRASPDLRVSYHFANESILSAAGTASKIHVIDFGISFGFQWPSLIQALARKKDDPPKLRITGVDLPQSGFHPAKRIKETGKRLEDYARDFQVPFEYHGIASQWESICTEDLNIRDDEVLIVNCMYMGKVPVFYNLSNKLLNLIQETKPKVFILGIWNVSFSPFFITRFRQVLLYFSRFFDQLDTFVPRDYKPRQLLETELFGPIIINLIACEGSDLVFRPETYKQCHMTNLQSGFEQFPVDSNIVKECSEIVRNGYNEEFFIEEDCNWFLQGWKGNIIYAISLWKAKVE